MPFGGEAIPFEELINYFKKKVSEINGVPEPDIDSNNDLLYSYNWPGNIRELRNLVERVSILLIYGNSKFGGVPLSIAQLLLGSESKESQLMNSLSYPLKEAREQFEKKYLINL